MLDIKFIRENKDLVAMAAKRKRIDFNVEELITVDDERRAALSSVEEKRSQQNAASDAIAQTLDTEARTVAIDEMRRLKEELKIEEEALKGVMERWQALMLRVPNLPDVSVPDGDDDSGNVEVRTWGERKTFDFPAKDHIAICEDRGWADFEKGAEVAGFRGYFLKGEITELMFAMWRFVMDHYIERGFQPMIVPSLVRRATLLGTGYLPQGEDDLYKTQDNDYLAGTGEVATMAYFAGTAIDKTQFPIKTLAFSPCFRREAGSHGKDVKGLYRVHEFFKFEQVALCEASHEESVKLHEELTRNAEEMMQKLEIPYRVVVNCGGDLGLGQVKKYDIEAWRPGHGSWGETHSSSYFHDFQTRRLDIRYRDDANKLRYAHSLNNTAMAAPRILIPFVENHQNADGTINIPVALRPYLGGRETL
jgi:seryl-tRNA synthetase